MRIAITGATGFIGQSLVARLRGNDVVAIGRQQHSWLPTYITDLCDEKALTSVLRELKPDVFIHLAWQGIPDFSLAMCKRNYAMHRSVFNAVASSRVSRVIVTGTCAEYQGLSGRVSEENTGTELGLFAQTKLDIYRLMVQLLPEKQHYWLRPFFVFGPRQRSGSLIPSVISGLKAGTKTVIQNPDAAQDFVHVDEVAQGICRFIDGSLDSGVYNLGTGQCVRVAQLVEWIEQAWFDKAFSPYRPASQGISADTTKLVESLDWSPTLTTPHIIQALVNDSKD